MHVRVKGFKIFHDRHGKRRCYHRVTNIAVNLEKCPFGSAEFFAECDRIAALKSAQTEPRPGTLGLMINNYRMSPEFTDLATRTQRDYQRCFDYLQPIADSPLLDFKGPLIVRIRDRAAEKHGRRFANYVKAVLSLLFSWGVQRGYVVRNPVEGIRNLKRQKGLPPPNRPWIDDERSAVLRVIPAHMKPALALMMYTGMDPQDAISLPRSCIKDGYIDSTRGKTGQPIWLPVPSQLQAIIRKAPKHDAITVCASSRGTPWTVSGYRASWRRVRMKLEAEGKIQRGLTLKGLRHTVATILRELGFDERAIADLLGQKTLAMAAHYSRHANLTIKNTATIREFEAEVNRRSTKVVKPI